MNNKTKKPNILLHLGKEVSSLDPFSRRLLIEGLLNLQINLFIERELKNEVDKILTEIKDRKKAEIFEEKGNKIDMLIFLEEQDKYEKELKKRLQKGVVPILSKEKAEKMKLEEFDPLEEKGKCFVFDEKNQWDILASLIRAWETYKYPYDWQNIVKRWD